MAVDTVIQAFLYTIYLNSDIVTVIRNRDDAGFRGLCLVDEYRLVGARQFLLTLNSWPGQAVCTRRIQMQM